MGVPAADKRCQPGQVGARREAGASAAIPNPASGIFAIFISTNKNGLTMVSLPTNTPRPAATARHTPKTVDKKRTNKMTNPENPPVPPPGYYPSPPMPQNPAPPWTATPPQYAAPSGNQPYWDGQNWQNPAPFAQQPAINRDDIRAAMAENRSIWVTNALAAWSLIIGAFSLAGLFFCGAGAGTAILGVIVGFLAFNKSKTTGAGRGMAIAGMAMNGAAFAIGCIVVMFVFVLAGAGSGAP
jgi:hypothetical protein